MAREQKLVYTIPGMDRVQVRRDVTYKMVDGEALQLDVYTPPDLATGGALPAVVFCHGDGPESYLREIRGTPQYTGWGRLAAAAGLVGVVFPRRSTEQFARVRESAGDVEDLFAFVQAQAPGLGIDAGRLAVWACSAGPPAALSPLLRDRPGFLRAVAIYYGVLDLQPLAGKVPPETHPEEMLREFSPLHQISQGSAPLPPVLIARAGLDSPALNDSLDRFVLESLRRNAPVEVLNHPAGHHGFDVFDDDDRSREIIARTLDFLRRHLGA